MIGCRKEARIEGEDLVVIEGLCRKLPLAESMRCHTPSWMRFYRDNQLFLCVLDMLGMHNAFGEFDGKRLSSGSMAKVLKRSHYLSLQGIVGADKLQAAEIE